MTRLFTALVGILFCLPLLAQNNPQFSRVRIDLKGKSMTDLAGLGIETDHGQYFPGRSFSTDLSADEIARVQTAGFNLEIVIPDVVQWYREQKQPVTATQRSGGCATAAGAPQYPTPSNYTYGSMGGYHTLDELLAVLDDMRAKFPNLISVRKIVSDSISTHEGRPQWYVKISDNPDSEEAEPEVLYTALHHAREPNGMSQMLYYMWYLLENYPNDPELQYIVNNVEMYFIPCLNPDGYVYNEQTNPAGGGFWRKNRRDNLNGTYGIDLNRNYGFEWGHDDSGSSPNSGSETYRGPYAFSEPETRMVRDFCLSHEFVMALNYHTYSNLLIYPWAYNDILAEPGLKDMGDLFTRYNHYHSGTSIQTVGYHVNGNSDDWIYGTTGAYSYTPEVGPGSYGFWPPFEAIDGLNKENVWPNLRMALCALQYAEAHDADNGDFNLTNPRLPVSVRRYGFQEGPVTVSLQALTPNISYVSAPIALEMAQFETLDTAFQLGFAQGTVSGETAVLLLQLHLGNLTYTDTLTKVLTGPSIPVFSDNCSNLTHWGVSGSWAVTGEDFVSAPFSITDSPSAFYEPGVYVAAELEPVFIPANPVSASLRFWAKWQTEASFDYVVVQAIDGNGAEKNLCGRYTHPGSIFEIENEPVFDGEQLEWVEECMDLTPFAGQFITLRFAFISDGFQEYDGYYFDDVRIEYTEQGFVAAKEIRPSDFRLSSQPNPASGPTTITWTNSVCTGCEAQLVVTNTLGKKVLETPVTLNGAAGQYRLETGNLPQGVYQYYLQTAGYRSETKQFSVLR